MKQTLTLARSRAPEHFIFWKLRTVSDKSHQPWGIATGNYSGQDARAAGDSNHRRPGDSLGALMKLPFLYRLHPTSGR